MGIETDTYKIKVGNGTSQWSALAYFIASWSEIPGKPTITSTPTAAAIALWDADKNLFANNHIDGFSTIVTANTTTTLTDASTKTQCFTGSTDHTLVMPSTGVVAGQQYMLINNSTGTINTLASNNGVIHVLGPSVECLFTALVDTPTLPAHWEDSFYGANFAAGKVLNVNTTLTLAGTDGTTFTFPSTSGTVVTLAATQSLSNKTLASPTITSATFTGRITPRIGTTASSATPSIDIDSFDQYNITALAAAITGVTVTGTPTDGQKLLVRIKDNGTARALTWGSSFMASGASPLPTTTVINKTHLAGFIYDAVAAKFVCVAADTAGY
jgi:hypothetical protein